jgi:hypothetical protein
LPGCRGVAARAGSRGRGARLRRGGLPRGRGALACALLAVVAWAGYGTHAEDGDPLRGGGEIVVDFQPTIEERNKHDLVIFLTTFAIAVHGTWYGRRR